MTARGFAALLFLTGSKSNMIARGIIKQRRAISILLQSGGSGVGLPFIFFYGSPQ